MPDPGSSGPTAPETRLYFGKLAVLLLESNELESDIVARLLAGFKVRSLIRCAEAAEAQDHVGRDPADLVLVGQAGTMADSFGFIRWLRRTPNELARTCPVILLAGHTMARDVAQARDCGASFVVAKPLSAQVLYERIAWLARDQRPFITSATYCGPDRRFQKLGPPPGTNGRRRDDLSLAVGEATAPNLSQDEIDAMLGAKVRA